MESGAQVADRQSAWRGFWRRADPRQLLRGLIRHRELLWQLTRREIAGRYRGSYLGVAWALLTPLASLGVYTFVFSFVFEARWQASAHDSGLAGFALILFTGIVTYNVFSETTVNAPYIVTRNANYVTKVVFPLEILPVTLVGAAVVHSFIGLVIIGAARYLLYDSLPASVLYLPLVYLPLIALAVGVAWTLAALGVFLRDVGHMAGVAVHLLFFVTPILYPVTALPAAAQPLMRLNPLATAIEDFRRILLWNQPPDWGWYAVNLVVSVGVMLTGYACFTSLRRAFADVI